MDTKKIRKEFLVTKRYAYLDNACIGPLSYRGAVDTFATMVSKRFSSKGLLPVGK